MKNKAQSLLIALAVLAVQATASGQLTVTNIAKGCNAFHSLFLKSDGSLWAMGYNNAGQLGDGTFSTNYPYGTNRPEEIVASGVTAVAVGDRHSLFLKSDGSLWAMGDDYAGQLGDGTFGNPASHYSTNQPEQIVASGVTAIAAGANYSLFLKSDGSLWAMGWNAYGQLGDGTFNNTNRPEQIVASGVTAIAAGYYHTLFLKSDGSLWGMGYNGNGELGDGTFNSTNRPEQIVAGGVTAIAAGQQFSLFLKSDGSLWAMGYNLEGALGDGTFNQTNRPEEIVASGVTAIAAGYRHSLFLKADGSLWGMGINTSGQLGDGTFSDTNKPEQIVAGGVTAIAAGDDSLFLKADGSLWGMGYDEYGALGDGFADTNSPYGPARPEQIVPKPQPVLAQALLSETNLKFTAACQFGGTFCLLSSTNIARPFNQWASVRTNVITSRYANIFSATLTNAVNSGRQQFYILQSQ